MCHYNINKEGICDSSPSDLSLVTDKEKSCVLTLLRADFLFIWITTYDGVSKSFQTDSIKKYMLTFGIFRCCPLQGVMAAKLTRLTHNIAIQLHLLAESCAICSSRSRRPVRKLLETPSYEHKRLVEWTKHFTIPNWRKTQNSLLFVEVSLYIYIYTQLINWLINTALDNRVNRLAIGVVHLVWGCQIKHSIYFLAGRTELHNMSGSSWH
jgi:hypothetical protein